MICRFIVTTSGISLREILFPARAHWNTITTRYPNDSQFSSRLPCSPRFPLQPTETMTRHLALVREVRIINPFCDPEEGRELRRKVSLPFYTHRSDSDVRAGARSKIVNQVLHKSAPVHSDSDHERADDYEIFFRKRYDNHVNPFATHS